MTHLLTMTCGMALGFALALLLENPAPKQKLQNKFEHPTSLVVRENGPRPFGEPLRAASF